MSDILVVTNRALCKEEFLVRIEKIAKTSPAGIILREKDLPEKEYRELAEQVMAICEKYQVVCILHSFLDVAAALNAKAIHLPLPVLRKISSQGQARGTGCEMGEYGWQANFNQIGASCHSVEEAVEAQKLGCTYITAGHIFPTDCKRGVPPRGLEFLRAVCESVDIPVYAIGGITKENIASVRETGANGACIMSGLMCCEDVTRYMRSFRKEGKKYGV